ncbi:MAG: hypothetical protein J7539_14620 [Niabella sp.]|nr:hypothetical protein [Niabella sp.]
MLIKRNLTALFTLLLLLCTSSLFSQKTIRDAWTGKDARIRASYGIIPDRGYDNIIKLEQLQTDKILFGNWISEDVGLIKNGGHNGDYIKNDFGFSLGLMADSVLIHLADTTKIPVRLIENADKSIVGKPSFFSGMRIKDTERLAAIRSKYQCDYLVVFKAEQVIDFLTRSSAVFPAQGLYKLGRNNFVYAGLFVIIISLETGKTVRSSLSPQSSADYTSLPYKNLNGFTPEERAALKNEIILRYLNNYTQLLSLLGILKTASQ